MLLRVHHAACGTAFFCLLGAACSSSRTTTAKKQLGWRTALLSNYLPTICMHKSCPNTMLLHSLCPMWWSIWVVKWRHPGNHLTRSRPSFVYKQKSIRLRTQPDTIRWSRCDSDDTKPGVKRYVESSTEPQARSWLPYVQPNFMQLIAYGLVNTDTSFD